MGAKKVTKLTKEQRELTTDQEELCDALVKEYVGRLDMTRVVTDAELEAACQSWLPIMYGLYDLTVPSRVEYADSIDAALDLAEQLTGSRQSQCDRVGIGYTGWVSRLRFYREVDVLSEEEYERIAKLDEFIRCAWDMIAIDECAIIVRRPITLSCDEDGNLHSNGASPCVEWRDGRREWCHHGTWITEKIACDPKSHTAEEVVSITNTEVRRALGERAGWDWMVQILGATSVDVWTDQVTGLQYELLRASELNLQWIKQQSPSLSDGSSPDYFEPVHEGLTTARGARVWQATSLSVSECENTELSYELET